VGTEEVTRRLREQFVDRLVGEGAITSPEWEAVFRRVPRHHFVPRVVGWWPPDSGETEGLLDEEHDRERWLQLVYSDRLLLVVKEGGRQSSSSMPSVMMRFLKGLAVQDGSTVLEIGTGTGYNAALLCERLRSERVTSIDVDAELVAQAGERLSACGYGPTLAVGDGLHGLAARAPYDRIIATCAVPRIPQAWLDQLAPGGIIVTPLAGGHFEPVGLVKLTAQADGSFSGHFHPGGASFMPLRTPAQVADECVETLDALVRAGGGETRPCRVPDWLRGGPREVNVTRQGVGLEPNFMVRLEVAELRWYWLDGRDGRAQPAIASVADRSWARVTMDEDGTAFVTQGGPRRLWDVVERSWDLFLHLGRPHMGRYGMTITPDRRQIVWLDDPASEHSWDLS
jgi:protein-L-isoaspartate(D-aspartate) O-methyltransferase